MNLNIPVYIGSVGLDHSGEHHKNLRIPPLWPPNHSVTETDKENMKKDNADNVDGDGNTTDEA